MRLIYGIKWNDLIIFVCTAILYDRGLHQSTGLRFLIFCNEIAIQSQQTTISSCRARPRANVPPPRQTNGFLITAEHQNLQNDLIPLQPLVFHTRPRNHELNPNHRRCSCHLYIFISPSCLPSCPHLSNSRHFHHGGAKPFLVCSIALQLVRELGRRLDYRRA